MKSDETSKNDNEASIQERISLLKSKLEKEASKFNSSHHSDLQSLAAECNKAINDLRTSFDQRLQEIQLAHSQNIASIEEEIAYLKELSDSQNLMLRNNIEYIQELEERYIKPGTREG